MRGPFSFNRPRQMDNEGVFDFKISSIQTCLAILAEKDHADQISSTRTGRAMLADKDYSVPSPRTRRGEYRQGCYLLQKIFNSDRPSYVVREGLLNPFPSDRARGMADSNLFYFKRSLTRTGQAVLAKKNRSIHSPWTRQGGPRGMADNDLFYFRRSSTQTGQAMLAEKDRLIHFPHTGRGD
ncbi:hypothetical protein NE237_017621 [Protea cynaroides]|uniref:Uncharacterized protein n=1 Tax=Protea cynaroides TaxID=273540 RepID=A0A9Q0QN66_9MAGN|nr:hypothetical protein NE237_017621 [Protea cynaroides]